MKYNPFRILFIGLFELITWAFHGYNAGDSSSAFPYTLSGPAAAAAAWAGVYYRLPQLGYTFILTHHTHCGGKNDLREIITSFHGHFSTYLHKWRLIGSYVNVLWGWKSRGICSRRAVSCELKIRALIWSYCAQLRIYIYTGRPIGVWSKDGHIGLFIIITVLCLLIN